MQIESKRKSFWLHELLSGNKDESQRWSASSVNGVSEAIGSNTFLNINSDRRALSRTCKSVGSKAKIFTPWIKTANLFNDESHWVTCICALDVDDSSLMHALFMLNYVSFPYRLHSFIGKFLCETENEMKCENTRIDWHGERKSALMMMNRAPIKVAFNHNSCQLVDCCRLPSLTTFHCRTCSQALSRTSW